MKISIFLGFILFVSSSLFSAELKIYNQIPRGQIFNSTGTVLSVSAVNTPQPPNSNFIITGYKGKVSLTVESYLGMPLITTGGVTFDVECTINVLYADGTSNSIPHIFSVDNSTDISEAGVVIDQDVLVFPNAKEITISNVQMKSNGVNLSSCAQNVSLEAEIILNRYFNLASSPTNISLGFKQVYEDQTSTVLNSGGSITYSGLTPKEIEVNWNYMAEAEEYELEWTWVDNYDINGSGQYATLNPASYDFTELDFKRNSTRVRVKNNNYRVPIIYGRGWLIFRVRPIGKYVDGNTVYENIDYYGDWTTEGSSIQHVSDWDYLINTEDHREGINWQFQSTYAEGGKKKEVVSYFDGSLRNRQTTTKINTNNKVVIGESIYDAQGRAAIQILPTPIQQSTLDLYPNMNNNYSGNPYSMLDFDFGSGCGAGAPPMFGNGATGYYGASGAEGNWQDFVPSAESYPFTQVVYTPDNTGRIRSQGGLGPNFQIGTDKETKYFYGQPTQEELNRLFGENVGNRLRYKKNMVVDPNGQVSVSILDPAGKVIATSLEGDGPSNLVALDENTNGNHVTVSTDLIGKNGYYDALSSWVLPQDAVDTDDDQNEKFSTGRFGNLVDGLQVNSQLLIGHPGNVDVSYDIKSTTFADATCTVNGLCFPFLYDLEVSMVNDCGTNLLTPDMLALGTDEVPDNTGGLACDTYSGVTTKSYSASVPSAGSYTINKKITVNEKGFNTALAQYMNSACVLTIEDFYDPNFNCDPADCEDCNQALGNPDGSDYLTQNGWDISQGNERKTELLNEFAELQAQCDLICNGPSSCTIQNQTLRSDFYPGGQYANIDDLNDPLSVFNDNNQLSLFLGNNYKCSWRNPSTPYADLNGNQVYAEITIDGNGNYSPALIGIPGQTLLTAPQFDVTYASTVPALIPSPTNPNVFLIEPQYLLNVTDFLDMWDPGFANSLYEYHPEYCMVKVNDRLCDIEMNVNGTMLSSDDYEYKLHQTVDYTTAQHQLNFAGGTLVGSQNFRIMNMDPFFNGSLNPDNVFGISTSYTNVKAEIMERALDVEYRDGLTMWDFAVKTVLDPYNTTPPNFNNATPAQKDQVWQVFKSLYFDYKKKIVQVYHDYYAINNNCFNGCIGSSPFTYNPVYYTFLNDSSDPYATALLTFLQSNLPDYTNNTLAADQLCNNDESYLYADKIQRFVPVTNLFDNSQTDSQNANDMAAEGDYNIYTQTGKCPPLLDMELFLNEFLTTLTTPTNTLIAHSSIPGLVPDLIMTMDPVTYINYTDIQGVYVSTAATSSSVLTISMTATNGNISNCPITLTFPTGINVNNLGSTWSILEVKDPYYVSYNSTDGYLFQMVFKISNSGVEEEIIVNGKSCVPVGECDDNPDPQYPGAINIDYSFECNKKEELENSFLGILNYLFNSGSSAYNGAFTNEVDFGVTNSVNHNFYNSTIFNEFLPGAKVGLQLYSSPQQGLNLVAYDFYGNNPFMALSLLSTSNNFPINANFGGFSSISIDDNNNYVLEYFDASGQIQQDAGTLIYTDYNASPTQIPLDLSCQCEESDWQKQIHNDLLNNFLNAVVTEYYSGAPYSVPNSIDPSFNHGSIIALEEFYGWPATGELNFNQHPGIVEELDQGIVTLNIYLNFDCFISISFPSSTFTSPLASPVSFNLSYDHNFYDIIEPNGTTRIMEIYSGIEEHRGTQITGSRFGLCFVNCEDNCIPEQIPPVSCTDKFDLYESTFINGSPNLIENYIQPNLDDHGYVLDEAYFCNHNLGYILDDYIYYLEEVVDANNNGTISDAEQMHPNFLTLAQFGDNALAYGSQYTTTAIDNFVTYYASCTAPDCYSWKTYVSDVFMVENPGICGSNPPSNILFVDDYTPDCINEWEQNVANSNQAMQYQIYLDNVASAFTEAYIEAAIATVVENMSVTYNDKQYHYTLYYYDQAGNLIQTVPPQGVNRTDNIDHGAVNFVRNNPDQSAPGGATTTIDHSYQTKYKYNSLNQLTWQYTPDYGVSELCYDALGRLVISQNAKQYAENNFSYTIYDELGRVVEVGQCHPDMSTFFYSIDHLTGKMNKQAFPGPTVEVDLTDPAFIADFYQGKSEVVITVYDEIPSSKIYLYTDPQVNNTRNRVVGVKYQAGNYYPGNTSYTSATWYDYDIHGKVRELIQEVNEADLALTAQTIKRLWYDYDLVSGNVKTVTYQKGQLDQFIHKYEYDADNRIVNVETSKDGCSWEKDAKYFYYDHGPLAREEIGDKKVQGRDYIYTIQGWIKSVNGEAVAAKNHDIGQDGFGSTNEAIPGDVFGYSLNYFEDDYTARINTGINPLQVSSPSTTPNSLYNGNIRRMYTSMQNYMEESLPTAEYTYTYDQLNRIKSMNSEGYDVGAFGGIVTTNAFDFASNYSYDKNGNLQQLNRFAGNGDHFDAFEYKYNDVNTGFTKNTNQLMAVLDDDLIATADGNYSDVINNHAFASGNLTNCNYEYDEIGQLIKDNAEGISDIKWTVTGKVKEIVKSNGDKIKFSYDAMGNRIAKKEYQSSYNTEISTYYVRDAQGNVMSTYAAVRSLNSPNTVDLKLKDRTIYGSSRLGVEEIGEVIASTTIGNVNIDNLPHRVTGNRMYEMSNHLGNVLSVVTDRKYLEVTNTIDFTDYNSDIVDFTKNSNVTISEDAERLKVEVAPRLEGVSRIFNLPTGTSYTITMDIDMGTTDDVAISAIDYSNGYAQIAVTNFGTSGTRSITFTPISNETHIKIWKRSTALDGILTHFFVDNISMPLANEEMLADVVSYSDYYPFGMQMPRDQRSGDDGNSYRYGFQGQEKDDEIKGEGNSVNYKYRIHDPRVGRFFAVDPMAYDFPYNSPYAFSENVVTNAIEMEGLELFTPTLGVNTPLLGVGDAILMESAAGRGSWLMRLAFESSPGRAPKPIEIATQTSAKLPKGKPMWLARMLRGTAAHKEVLGRWARNGFDIEHWLGRVNGKGNRIDGLKIEKAPNGSRVGILRELKPNTTWGRAAGYRQLARYFEAAKKMYPEVETWTSELHLYSSATFVTGNFHKVESGETLTGIAEKYNTTVEALTILNNIEDPSKIKAGEELLVDFLVEFDENYKPSPVVEKEKTPGSHGGGSSSSGGAGSSY